MHRPLSFSTEQYIVECFLKFVEVFLKNVTRLVIEPNPENPSKALDRIVSFGVYESVNFFLDGSSGKL